MTNNQSSIGFKVALCIALTLFLGTGFYASKLYYEKKDTEMQLNKEKQIVMKDLSNMAEQYEIAIIENDIANEKLIEAKERIYGLLDSLKVSQANVGSLWKYKKKYLALQKEMDFLLVENDRLKVENQLLATSLDSTKVRLEQRTMFTDSLLVQNTALAEVVETAAVLNTVALKGYGVIERNSGKLIPTERARRVDKLRVCYTVTKNGLVQAGDQELFVQIIDPNNNVLGDNVQVEFEDGETLNYSMISKFNYENKSLDICEFVASSDDNKFEKGRYVVNVFNDKELVSSNEFSLK